MITFLFAFTVVIYIIQLIFGIIGLAMTDDYDPVFKTKDSFIKFTFIPYYFVWAFGKFLKKQFKRLK